AETIWLQPPALPGKPGLDTLDGHGLGGRQVDGQIELGPYAAYFGRARRAG
ncbi:MAG: hypothetical protein RLZZ584_4583, partial [Pseudomonadota bacterium]